MIKIGDKIVCRLYNTPEHRFYGKYFVAKVNDIRIKDVFNNNKEFFITPFDMSGLSFWIDRREIKRILK